jgi:stage V sporulation protein SpoVS
VEQVDGAELGFGDAVGAAEIEADGRGIAFALGHVGEDGIDLLLRQFPVQIPRSWVSYRLSCAKL